MVSPVTVRRGKSTGQRGHPLQKKWWILEGLVVVPCFVVLVSKTFFESVVAVTGSKRLERKDTLYFGEIQGAVFTVVKAVLSTQLHRQYTQRPS